MALFSDKLTEDEKSRLASKILTFESKKPSHWDTEEGGEVGYELGKPVMDLIVL